jgi:hypothetical protein
MKVTKVKKTAEEHEAKGKDKDGKKIKGKGKDKDKKKGKDDDKKKKYDSGLAKMSPGIVAHMPKNVHVSNP